MLRRSDEEVASIKTLRDKEAETAQPAVARICSREGCTRKLRADNTKGVCGYCQTGYALKDATVKRASAKARAPAAPSGSIVAQLEAHLAKLRSDAEAVERAIEVLREL